MDRPTVSQLLDLHGRAALVTGGAMGIGEAIALRLAEAGASVVITDLEAAAASRVATRIRELGGSAIAITANGASASDAVRVVEETVKAFGGLDVLVNNAGIFPPSPFLDTPAELLERVVALNLNGVFLHSQAAARRMVARGRGGAIVNIGSIDAIRPAGGLAHYDATKGGVVMLTRSLALELAPHRIRVNVVDPGAIATPGAHDALAKMSGGRGQDAERAFEARIPLRRMGDPDEIARAVLFLASDAASYVTGSTLVVDGGYLLT